MGTVLRHPTTVEYAVYVFRRWPPCIAGHLNPYRFQQFPVEPKLFTHVSFSRACVRYRFRRVCYSFYRPRFFWMISYYRSIEILVQIAYYLMNYDGVQFVRFPYVRLFLNCAMRCPDGIPAKACPCCRWIAIFALVWLQTEDVKVE